MSSFNYVDSPNVNLLCCICRSPFVEPCTARTCCHTFCYECIAQAIDINHQCPIDRAPLTLYDLTSADPVVRNLVDELIVRCPQEPLGCSYTCQRLLLPMHLKDACQFVETRCPEGKCSERVLKKDVKQHRCTESAAEKLVAPDEQSQPVIRNDDPQSEEAITTPTPASRVAVEGQSSVDLAAENAMLRIRLSALESVVHTLRGEMFAVKHALGPWYRPDVQSQLFPEEQSDSEDFEASSEAFERQLAEQLATHPAPGSDVSSSPTTRDPADITAYFPPAEDAIPQSTQSRHRNISNIGRAHPTSSLAGQSTGPTSPPNTSYTSTFPSTIYAAFPTPGQTTGMAYSQGTSFPTPSPATISVPPLDPTTPLPDTLATLHSSLVTLAGALGALAAARGAESLRTTEELRGLRAATHGLRMQVHDILTSRAYLTGNGTPGAAGSSDGDGSESAPFNLGVGVSGWLGHGPRPYGLPPMHPHLHPPHFGGPSVPLPTNITKL